MCLMVISTGGQAFLVVGILYWQIKMQRKGLLEAAANTE
jgi:hypothetical protein